jgi:hypothetical protein
MSGMIRGYCFSRHDDAVRDAASMKNMQASCLAQPEPNGLIAGARQGRPLAATLLLPDDRTRCA